ncbi:hypothetical protein [uncultured Aquimarina sp.]|uniref:hypothetical protein n=1 Tax=uncultured Aquimarina sp. TaxID=575652 RepID=UPI00262338D1|nr:hypothetical protein [uncultured Aquimarina sp.]
MKQEQQLLYKVMRNFEGMQKIEVFDLLQRMEILMFYTKSPLRSSQIKKIMTTHLYEESEIDPFGFTILPNGNFCEFEGCNDWIHIYKETKRGINKLNPFTTYYYRTKYAPLELVKLTKKNLLESLEKTLHQEILEEFLLTYKKIIQKDKKNRNRLLLILDY